MDKISYEQIRKMRKGNNAFDVCLFPFLPNVKIAIRVLTQYEVMDCIDKGRVFATENLRDPNEQNKYTIGMGFLLLKSVYCVPEDPTEAPSIPFFENIREVLELSVDEISLLEESYATVQEKYAPYETLKSAEDFETLIDGIKKKLIDSNSLSSYTLKRLV